MNLPGDLLAQARLLTTKEPRRPKQASLRRAVSAAYYALFHLLVHDASRRFVRSSKRAALRQCLRRAFDHASMRRVARQFAARGVSPKLSPGLNEQPLQEGLVTVALTFVDLQQHRHEADYDLRRTFTRHEVLGIIHRAERAVRNWCSVRGSVQADTLLIGLLAFEKMRG